MKALSWELFFQVAMLLLLTTACMCVIIEKVSEPGEDNES